MEQNQNEGQDNSILISEPIPKLFVQFAVPALIAMVVMGVQGIIDGIFVGNYIGPDAMASVTIANPFLQILIGLSMIISAGSQSHIGIKLGMGEEQKAKDTFQTLFRIIVSLALIVALAGSFFSNQIATALGADELLLPSVATYIQTISWFAIPVCLMMYFGSLVRILGKPELFLFSSLLSVVVNIALDYLFIANMQLGIRGAAMATGIAYSSGLLITIWPMLNKENIINVFAGKFSSECIKPVLYNGSSEGINSMSIAITTFLFNISLMTIAGSGGVAAYTAINYVATFGGLLLFGISDGIGPIISYNYGHGSLDRVKHTMKIAYITNLISGIVVFILLYFFGEQLVSLFIKDSEELVQLAVSGGKLYGIAFLMSGFNILNSGYFTFIGNGLNSVIVAASRGIIFVTVGMFVLPTFLGVDGVWLSVPFAEFCACIVGILLLKKPNKQSNAQLA